MESNVSFKRAQRLKVGDAISIIAPASPFARTDLETSIGWLEAQGYKCLISKSIFSRNDYLAGSDHRRANELMAAWNAKSRAVFCARGGYGSLRLYDHFKIQKIRQHTKIFMGMSDLTVLLNYVTLKTGVITIHGPVLAGEQFSKLAHRRKMHLFDLLSNSVKQELFLRKHYDVFQKGCCTGRLFGGNLAMIAASIGTPFETKPRGNSILFLEDTGEPLYRIDRMLAQLYLSGFLKKFCAVILGDFTNLQGKIYSMKHLTPILSRYISKGTPVVYGVASSHAHMETLLPIGGKVSIESKTIVIDPLVSS
ncbi:MAG: LD-carboxypeptidase [Bdellovibrionales bacterium]|nr:LD-carboxypeptidase [Bdellovibrionales bacterium]